MPASDIEARTDALDPARSFIVQAPAGSGKTELLIQRYLRLLATVERPEQILAITFTRKAAGEMRERVLKALQAAAAGDAPGEEHLRKAYRLAQDTIARDREQDWRLLLQPQRLRIQTIDAVNARLSGGAPFSAGHTASFRVAENADVLYGEAARQTIAYALEPDATGDAVRELLIYFDNDVARLEKLLSSMLARRDLWLRHVVRARAIDEDSLRADLFKSLRSVIETHLRQLRQLLPEKFDAELANLLRGAAERMRDEGRAQKFSAWLDGGGFPAPASAELSRWQTLAELLLTKRRDGPVWRRRFDARIGFPAARAERAIEQMTSIVGRLQRVDGLAAALHGVRTLPNPDEPASWPIVDAALAVLPTAVAMLRQVFKDRRERDFAEVAQEALLAVGSEDAPSELGLQLDYRLRHILVDEFQDTSHAQFDLLVRLTAGWQIDSGETLFVVGDPMQSIYRFREAEVRLFLRAWESGIGSLPLNRLTLSANFRSDRAIVEWNNRTFAAACAAGADLVGDAVEFAPSEARNPPAADAGVQWHRVAPDDADADAEAQRVVALVQEHLANANGSLGILVRSRSHAQLISFRLRKAGIRFGATELEKLVEQSVVQDLVALTRGLYHLGDRLAWLAILRAPWCGLTLVDLHALASADHEATIWSLAHRPELLQNLSADGRHRLRRVCGALARALGRRGRLPVRDVVESAWLDLGGPATLAHDSDNNWVDRILMHLDTVEVGADITETATITTQLNEVYLSSVDTDCPVQIMTMHKAKGLEFDTVILPGLARTPRSSEKPLLLTYDPIDTGPNETTLFAVRSAPGSQPDDALYEYLWGLERRANELELDRLFYVATTRARRKLHLLVQLDQDADTGAIKAPKNNCLLARIWPQVAPEFETMQRVAAVVEPRRRASRTSGRRDPDWRDVSIRRLPTDWAAPDLTLLPESSSLVAAGQTREDLSFDWASGTAIFVGKVVHRWLQKIAAQGPDAFSTEDIDQLRPCFRRQLQSLGVDSQSLATETERVAIALVRAVTDPTGQWILSRDHDDAENELPITHDQGLGTQRRVIDRTFITQDGDRWIIDYKSGSHEGGAEEAFIVNELQRYRDQLLGYRDALRELDTRPIRAALYFPMLGVLREIDLDGASDKQLE